MTLRERAEQAARECLPEERFWDARDQRLAEVIADAIQRVAREFAEKACAKLSDYVSEIEGLRLEPDDVAAAIAEAEK